MSVRINNEGSVYNGMQVNTPYEKEADKGVKVEDFLQLMVAQLSNQDFMNPVDDTQYISQLAQFASMQSMKEMNYYTLTNYVTNLVGKTATVASLGLGGSVDKDTGVISTVNLSGDKYTVVVNGKTYELSQIMSVSDSNSTVSKKEIDEASKMALMINQVGTDFIKFRWPSPVDDPELDKDLVYDVYYTDDGQLDMSTVHGTKQAKLAASGISAKEFTLSGLSSEKTYFINVVVRNKNGDEAVYQDTAQTTKS